MTRRAYYRVDSPGSHGPSFGETLVNFGILGPLLDFDMLVEVGTPRRG
jgi:hypothetical protein